MNTTITTAPAPTKQGTRTTKAGRKDRRGFASMSPEKRREIASMGGKAAHQLGTAHRWTSEEAQRAGRIGGLVSRRPRLPIGPSDRKPL